MARVTRALAFVALSLSLLAPRAHAVSLWEFALPERPGMSLDAQREAERNMVVYQLQNRTFPLPAAVASLALQQVRQQYELALRLDPNNATALAALAQMEERDGRHEIARAYAERSLALAPNGPRAPDVHFTLALIHTRQERFDQARDDYLRELTFTLDDDDLGVLYGNLGDTYVSLDDLSQAIAAYEAAVRVNPTSLAWLGLAVTLDRVGSDASAQADHAVRAATNARHARTLGLRGLPTGNAGQWAIMSDLADPNVFFVPPHDRHYYEGVGLEAVARELAVSQPADAPEALRSALRAWETYLQLASPTDRWRLRAERHAASLRASLAPHPSPSHAARRPAAPLSERR